MDVAITGSSGLIGKALKEALREAGDRPIGLVRRPARGADEIQYDPAAGTLDGDSLEGIDAVVNLAGAGIGDKRWTAKYKRLLVDSRVDVTSLVASTIAGLNNKPSVLLSGSAVGIYGDRGATVNTEMSEAADTFLADLCIQWELAAAPAVEAGIRTAFLRTGIVLAPRGGALQKMLPLFKLGVGGPFGLGRQSWSWITLDDEVRAIQYLLKDDHISGPVNLTAPHPVTNRQFSKTLASVLSRPALVPIPKFGPSLLIGRELAQALLFDSAHVEPTVLNASAFEFNHPELEVGLRDLLDKP